VPLVIHGSLTLPDRELEESFVRAAGPGGQNVNKVSSAVQLRFRLQENTSLSPAAKQRLCALAGHRLTDEGAILITARTSRSQERNRAEARERLADLIRRALIEPVQRHKTRPTRASKERRLDWKSKRGTAKARRARPPLED